MADPEGPVRGMEGDPVNAASQPKANIEAMLYTVQYKHDRHSHIDITQRDICLDKCGEEWGRPCTTFCPAKVYEWDGQKIAIAYENCVECTSCLLGCPYRIIDWRLPRGGYGVHYRFG